MFTSTTCGPCVTGNSLLTGILSSSEAYLGVIRYHVWWPGVGNDPFYNYNKSENANRVNTYGVNAVPALVVDGTKQSSSGTWQSAIDARHAVESPFYMKVYRSYEKSAYSAVEQGSGKVLIEITNETESAQTFNLYGGLTENDVQYTGLNGDPTHQQVMIKMIPWVYGNKIDLAAGQTKGISFDYAIDDTIPFLDATLTPTGETHIVNAQNCELIFWCQSPTTKEVLQAANIEVPGAKTLLVEDVSVADASGDGNLSPDEEGYVHAKISNGSSSKMTKVHVLIEVDNKNVSVVTGMYEISEIPAKGNVTLSGKELVLKAGASYDGSACKVSCSAGSGSSDASLGFSTESFGGVEETLPRAQYPSSPRWQNPVRL